MTRDPQILVLLFLSPLLLLVFLGHAWRSALASDGYTSATGAEQAVPGLTVMFGFFIVGFVGFAFFRDLGCGMWDRIRVCPIRPLEIVVGKLLPPAAVALAQQIALFGVGVTFLGLKVHSWPELVLVAVSYVAVLVTLGAALTSFVRSAQQVNAFANVGAIVLGGVGGALAPSSVLPAWLNVCARTTPTYWAMTGFREAILPPPRAIDIGVAIAILWAFALAFAILASTRLRVAETRVLY